MSAKAHILSYLAAKDDRNCAAQTPFKDVMTHSARKEEILSPFVLKRLISTSRWTLSPVAASILMSSALEWDQSPPARQRKSSK